MWAAIKAQRRKREIERDSNAIRQRCTSLSGFIREAWHVLEGDTGYVHGWHIDAICEHLEAVTSGEIQHLAMHVPPGSMKSLTVSVMWPAWEWGPMGRPNLRYMSGAYEQTLALRDNRRMRRLIESDWYQSLWPLGLTKTGDELFENSAGGERRARAFRSMTGGRAHRVIIDDPHSTETAESEAERARTVRVFRESIQDRLTDQSKDSIVVIMQRLHAKDVGGTVKELSLPYERLVIPMEFEAESRCATSIGWADPRTYDGELMCPERWPRKIIDDLKNAKGSHAWAGQYQQRPTPREGGMFKRHWFEGKTIGAAPEGTRWVRHWDLAASRDRNAARTAGVKLGRTPDGRYVVGHAVKTQEEGAAVRRLIKATAETDGKAVEISLPQDPGQAGKTQKADMIAMLAGWSVRAAPETGDKATRAEPFAVQCEAGNVYLVEGAWNESYIDELCEFPGGAFADQVDASSGAFARLASARPPTVSTFGPKVFS